jgi:hypothetical protein
MKSILVIVLLFALVPVLEAQDGSADEILSCFPEGRYLSISYYNLEALQKGELYPVYKKYFLKNYPDEEALKKNEKNQLSSQSIFIKNSLSAPILDFDRLGLPMCLQKDIRSITLANPVSLTDLDTPEASTVQQITIDSPSADGEEKVAFFIQSSQSIAAFEYHDLRSAIKEAVQKGFLNASGSKLFGKPVFALTYSKKAKRSIQFAWPSDNQRLLVADSLKTLEKMAMAEQGQIQSLLDNPDFVDLVSLFPDLGPAWKIFSARQSSDELSDAMYYSGADNEKIDAMIQRSEKQALFTITCAKITDIITLSYYEVFENTSAAEEHMEANQKDMSKSLPFQNVSSPEYQHFQNEVKRLTKSSLEANVVIYSISFDEVLLKQQEEASSALAKSLQESNGNIVLKTKDGKVLTLETAPKKRK